MFLKPLKAQTMWKTLEMIIVLRMQSMVQIEFAKLILMVEILFDFFLKFC